MLNPEPHQPGPKELYLKPTNAHGHMHTGALVPEDMTQQVWSRALASVPRNTRLPSLTFPFLETAYP